MTKINGQEIIQTEYAPLDGLRGSRRGEGDVIRSMNAHMDAFFLKRGMPLNNFGFRAQTNAEIQQRRRRRRTTA